MTVVVFSLRARRSLFDTIGHIAEHNPKAAINLILDIQKRAVETLGTFPDAGVRWGSGRRVLTIKRYALIYSHDSAKGEVVVLDVFGPGMDWQ